MPPRPWSSAERSQGGCMWHDALEDPLSKSMPHCLWVRMLERAVWANSPACLSCLLRAVAMATASPCYMHGNSPWGRDGKGKDWMRAAHLPPPLSRPVRLYKVPVSDTSTVPGDPVLAVCVRLESTSSVLLRRWQRQHCSHLLDGVRDEVELRC